MHKRKFHYFQHFNDYDISPSYNILILRNNLENVYIYTGKLNSNSRPDKSSIVNIMTNQIKDVELKEFIQDSIDECFDTLELGKLYSTIPYGIRN